MEGSTKAERLIREEHWINEFKNKNIELYNNRLKPTDEPKNRSCFSLTPEETKQKLSIASKKKWQDPAYLAKNPCGTLQEKSERMFKLWQRKDFKEKMIQVNKKNSINQELLKKLIEGSQKTYNGLISPDGTVYSPITNLSKFARDNNLIYGNLYQLITGKWGQYDGWKSVDNPNPTRKKVVLSEEHKIKIGLAMKGHKYNIGHRHTEESKKKMSMTRTGRPNPSAVGNKNRLGMKHTEESKKNFLMLKEKKLWKNT